MLINPSSLYGGGAVKIDLLSPAINYMAKQQERDAKVDAQLSKYYGDLTKNATSKGMREEDIPAYNKALQDYNNFWLQNQKSILRGDVNLQMQAKKMAQVPFDIASESIGTLNDQKQVAAVLANPEVKDRIDVNVLGTDENGNVPLDPTTNQPIYTGIQAAKQPIYIIGDDGTLQKNPAYKPFDVTQIVFNPKTMSAKEMQDAIDAQIGDLEYDEVQLSKVVDPKDKYTYQVTTQTFLNDDKLRQIGNTASTLYDDKTYAYNFDKKYPKNSWAIQHPTEFNAANEVFKRLYGNDIDNNRELLSALTILAKDKKGTKLDYEPNVGAKINADFFNQVRIETMRKKNKGEDIQTGHVVFDDLPNGQIAGSSYTVKDGMVYDSKGNLAKGKIKIPKQNLPLGMIDLIKRSGTNPLYISSMDATVENGVIQEMSNKFSGSLRREDAVVADQLLSGGKKGKNIVVPQKAPKATGTKTKKKFD